jgi:dTDP-4-amino-4,6-dideoxygalactose transaminase
MPSRQTAPQNLPNKTALTTPATPTTPLPFLPFARPEIGEDEIAEVVDTLRSGWITTGPKARRFEEDFIAFLGDDRLHAMAVSSATAGLHLALEALGVGPGDEVITTTHTFTATAEVVHYLGAKVVLVDIDPATLCIDIAAVEAALTPRTKVVIPVHYAGLAADMPALLKITQKNGCKVVEDAAHALPTKCAGQWVGTLGSDATVFSFYANKTITTGEGGMVVTRDAAIAQRIKIMRMHGINRDAFDRFTAKLPSWYYEIVAPGFKYNLNDIAAALGLHQLKKAHDFAQRRAAIAAQYGAQLSDLPLLMPPQPKFGATHSWHLFVVRLTDAAPIDRDAFIQALFAAGIGCSVHYIPLHLQPYWRDTYQLQPEQFAHSQHAFERLVSLPIYPGLTVQDVSRITRTIRQALHAQAAV